MFLLLLASGAAAAPAYNTPNSLLGVSGGTPTVVSVRGEAWMSEAASFEVGGGVTAGMLDAWLDGTEGNGDAPIFDAALRWRPRFLCVGCGERVLGTFGLGVGSVVRPDPELLGPWTWAAGPDVVATMVIWSTPTFGWHVSARGGGGAQFLGNNFRDPSPAFWAFGSVGMAF